MSATLTRDELWEAIGKVLDPEVPVLSVVDLGIVRDIRIDHGVVDVDVTPTYSGCPAMQVIEHDIVDALQRAGAETVRVNTVYQPAWTTAWISAGARERLRAYGIAPPETAAPPDTELVPLRRRNAAVPCPYCASTDTELRSEFGSTACKAICFCNACRQPFEHFKAI
jgi:ring-1,2-phenylacetyl-CoA epoxidase subunit PaaD